MLTGILILGAILVIAGAVAFARRRQQEQAASTVPIQPVYIDPLVGHAPETPLVMPGGGAAAPRPMPAAFRETAPTAPSEGATAAVLSEPPVALGEPPVALAEPPVALAEPPAVLAGAAPSLPEQPAEAAASLGSEPGLDAYAAAPASDPLASLDLRALIDGLSLPAGDETEETDETFEEVVPEVAAPARPKRSRPRVSRAAAADAVDEERPPVLDEAAIQRAERRRRSLRDIARRFSENNGGGDPDGGKPAGPSAGG